MIILYSEERQNIIIDHVNSLGKVTVKDLSNELEVSEVTIRRDLDLLDEKGLIKRTFGGAIQTDSIMKEYSLSEREKLNIDEKQAISERAIHFIEDGMSIYIDSGTTVKILATNLDKFNNLSIFTADLLIAHRLIDFENIEVTLLGGVLDKDILTANSAETLNTIKRLYFDLSYIGCDAFDQIAIYSSSEMRATIKKEVIENSEKTILLSDSSKFNQKKLYQAGKLNNFNCIITDDHDPLLNNSLTKHRLITVSTNSV